jgi:hypothetical protein
MKYKLHRSAFKPLAILVTLVFVALTISSPALAKHNHKPKHHKQKHHQKHKSNHHHAIHYASPGYAVAQRPYVAPVAMFRVPGVIEVGLRGKLRPYYLGRAFSPVHGHKHRVYDFPVRRHGRIEYRQHYYCEGRLFMAESFDRNGYLSISLAF